MERLKLLDHIEMIVTGNVAKIGPSKIVKKAPALVDINFEAKESYLSQAVRFKLSFELSSIVRNGASGEELLRVKRQVAKIFAHAIYGDVKEEIYRILKELLENGDYNHPAAESLENLLTKFDIR
jgi:hypothetical protein